VLFWEVGGGGVGGEVGVGGEGRGELWLGGVGGLGEGVDRYLPF